MKHVYIFVIFHCLGRKKTTHFYTTNYSNKTQSIIGIISTYVFMYVKLHKNGNILHICMQVNYTVL